MSLQATVVNDMKTLDVASIDPGNRITVGDTALSSLRKKMAQPMAAMSAFKRAARANDDTNGVEK